MVALDTVNNGIVLNHLKNPHSQITSKDGKSTISRDVQSILTTVIQNHDISRSKRISTSTSFNRGNLLRRRPTHSGYDQYKKSFKIQMRSLSVPV